MAGVPQEPLKVQYGGFEFPVETQTTGIHGRMIYDRAGRTVTSVVYRINLSTYIQSEDGTDAQVEAARKELERPALPFIYQAGAGGLNVNTKPGKTDCVWGPKPQVIALRPKGAPNCWQLDWEVEVCVAILAVGPDTDGKIMEFNFTVAYNVDYAGYNTRTYSGFLRVAQTRPTPDNRELHVTADAFLEKIVPKPLEDFRRTVHQRQLDEAKCTLNFTIVDDEFRGAIPPYTAFAVKCRLSHRVSTMPLAMIAWGGTIEAEYELIKGVLPAKDGGNPALAHFMKVYHDRTKAGDKDAGVLVAIPTDFSMTEPDAYGPPMAQFSITYRYCRELAGLMKIPGLWRPMPDGEAKDWAMWQEKVGNVIAGGGFNQPGSGRGLQRMIFKSADDSIWDLGVPDGKDPTTPGNEKVPPNAGGKKAVGLAVSPPANKSWLEFYNGLRLEQRDETVEQKTLTRQLREAGVPVLSILDIPGGVGYVFNAYAGRIITQIRAPSSVHVVMQGWAMRAGHSITQPRLLTAMGVPVVPANLRQHGFKCATVGNFGVPVNKAVWSLRYKLTASPANGASLKQLPNPMMETGTINESNQINFSG
jgi:hypothetical protein